MPHPGASLTAVLSLLLATANTPALAENAILRMTRADCKRLVAHRPAPDVTYRPGVDVRGRAVAPAQAGDGVRLPLSEEVVIPIELELLERLRPAPGRTSLDARVLIGTVELRDGRAVFNGQPLEDETQVELAAKCRELLAKDG